MQLKNFKLILSTILFASLLISCDINLTAQDILEDYLDSSTLVYTSEINIDGYQIDTSIITINKNKSVTAYYYSGSNEYDSISLEGKSDVLLKNGFSNYLKDLDMEEDLNLIVNMDDALRYEINLTDNSLPILTNLSHMVTGNFSDTIDSLSLKYALLIYTYSGSENVEIYLRFDNDDDIVVILTTS